MCVAVVPVLVCVAVDCLRCMIACFVCIVVCCCVHYFWCLLFAVDVLGVVVC